MKQFRVTKYNPKYRNPNGSYLRDDWTSFGDVGDSITEKEYLEIENSYIDSAVHFIEEQSISQLSINNLENAWNAEEPGIQLQDAEVLGIDALKRVLKSILREKYWAKLETDDAFIHLGYDYYMYIGVPAESVSAKRFAESKGLFVEKFQSPYYENEF